MDNNYLTKFEKLSNTLSKVGWFVPSFLIQWEFDKLEEICNELDSENDIDTDTKNKYITKINALLSETAFSPFYRAFFLYRSKEVQHASEYSHLYEKSIFHYYNNDFISTILTMLPAIEGSLLSYYGWIFSSGERKPGQRLFINKLKTETLNSGNSEIDELFKIYGRVLATFLEDWIFSDTDSADLSTSWLNRHILVHGMSPVNFNRQLGANRLVIYFDLLINYFSLLDNIFYSFIPTDKSEIQQRQAYFVSKLISPQPINNCIQIEDNFLNENKNYYSPEILYDMKASAEKLNNKFKEYIKNNKQ